MPRCSGGHLSSRLVESLSSGAIVRTTEQLGSHLVDLGRGGCSTPRTSVLLTARPDYQAGDGGRPNLSKGQMIGFVFAFVADVRNDPRWHTDVLEAHKRALEAG
jgi:hypothetical protein